MEKKTGFNNLLPDLRQSFIKLPSSDWIPWCSNPQCSRVSQVEEAFFSAWWQEKRIKNFKHFLLCWRHQGSCSALDDWCSLSDAIRADVQKNGCGGKRRKKRESKCSESSRLCRHKVKPGRQGSGGVRWSSLVYTVGGKSSKVWPKPKSNFFRSFVKFCQVTSDQ